MRLINLVGKTFGRLTVVSRANDPGRRVYWRCACSCGNETSVMSEALLRGLTESCGCLRTELLSKRSMKHGHTLGPKGSHEHHSPEYRIWSHAKGRCFNQSDPKFPQYGARGITMCESWRSDFSAFYKYMGKRPTGMTLDRIDVNGNYEPQNCRWATPTEQSRNKQDSVRVTWKGREVILKEVAEIEGVDYKRLHRLYRKDGMSLAESIETCRH